MRKLIERKKNPAGRCYKCLECPMQGKRSKTRDVLQQVADHYLDELAKYTDAADEFGFDYREETNVGFIQRACSRMARPKIFSIQEFHDGRKGFSDLALGVDGKKFVHIECKQVWLENSRYLTSTNAKFNQILDLDHDDDDKLEGADWVCWFIVPSIRTATWNSSHKPIRLTTALKNKFQNLIENTAKYYGASSSVFAARTWETRVRGSKGNFIRFGVGVVMVPKDLYLRCRKRSSQQKAG